MFEALQALHIHHGDMKASNLLSDGKTFAVIDYDGINTTAALLHCKTRCKKTTTPAANWQDNATLQQQLREAIAT